MLRMKYTIAKTYIEIGTNAMPEWGISHLKNGHRVIFVEAHPHAFSEMCENVAKFVSRVLLENAVFINAAVACEDRMLVEFELMSAASIRSNDFWTALSATPIQHRSENVGSMSVFWTTAISLKTLFAIYAPVEMVLLDIEGAEIDVLRGWSETACPHGPVHYLIEHHNIDIPIAPFLKKKGYRCVKVEENPMARGSLVNRHIYWEKIDGTDPNVD